MLFHDAGAGTAGVKKNGNRKKQALKLAEQGGKDDMGNTGAMVLISFLCVLAHIPTLILRIVPFYDKINKKQKYQLIGIYLAALVVNFLICLYKEQSGRLDVSFYK